MKIKTLIVISSILGLVGCGSILGPQSKRSTQYYQLIDSQASKKPLNNCTSYENNLSIYVSPVDVVQPYDDYKIYYETESYMVNSYSYSQWAIPVASMTYQAIVQSLITSCAFKTVNSSSMVTSDSYRLITSVKMVRHELDERNHVDNAHLIISNQLVDIRNARVVNSFIFDDKLQTDGTPLGFVKSSSDLMAIYDTQLLNWMKANTLQSK